MKKVVHKTVNEKMNVEIEMICAFMYEMSLTQLKKLSNYAAKLFSDKRYKKKQ